jgi:hypothetical protein
MMSGCSKRSIFLACFAFIALLLMSGNAAVSAHARATMVLDGTAPYATAQADMSSANGQGGWQQADTHDDASGGCLLVDDHDIDDALVLPSSVHVWLDYYPSAAPLSAGASLYPVPVASLLRPPSLA